MRMHPNTWTWVIVTLIVLFLLWLLFAGVIGGHGS